MGALEYGALEYSALAGTAAADGYMLVLSPRCIRILALDQSFE